jgi:hypothetical protein
MAEKRKRTLEEKELKAKSALKKADDDFDKGVKPLIVVPDEVESPERKEAIADDWALLVPPSDEKPIY